MRASRYMDGAYPLFNKGTQKTAEAEVGATTAAMGIRPSALSINTYQSGRQMQRLADNRWPRFRCILLLKTTKMVSCFPTEADRVRTTKGVASHAEWVSGDDGKRSQVVNRGKLSREISRDPTSDVLSVPRIKKRHISVTVTTCSIAIQAGRVRIDHT